MTFRRLFCLAVLAGLTFLWAGTPAQAGFVLQVVSSGGPGALVTDQGSGDSNPVVGAITVLYGFPQGDVTFATTVTTGTSKPLIGSPGDAEMDLNNVTVDSTGPGTLRLLLTDTGFNGFGFGGFVIQQVGGTITAPAGSTATFQTFKDPRDQEFGTTLAFSTLGPFGPGVIAGTATDPHGPLNLYSMTQEATLVFTGAGQMSFNFNSMNTVPEPSSLALAAIGALGIVGYGLRRRRGA